jgi:hypothetical protein
VNSPRRFRSLRRQARNVLARGVGVLRPDHAGNLPAECSIGWQPSLFRPVFYGHRDYMLEFPVVPDVVAARFDVPRPGGELPTIHANCRVFFPR